MIKQMATIISAVMVGGLLASGVYAAPVTLNDTQLDSVAAGGAARMDGFVCPVIKNPGVDHNPHEKAHQIGETGYYTVVGPNVSVPVNATNRNGAGYPSGNPETFDKPGDIGYTAIWNNGAFPTTN